MQRSPATDSDHVDVLGPEQCWLQVSAASSSQFHNGALEIPLFEQCLHRLLVADLYGDTVSAGRRFMGLTSAASRSGCPCPSAPHDGIAAITAGRWSAPKSAHTTQSPEFSGGLHTVRGLTISSPPAQPALTLLFNLGPATIQPSL